MKKLLAIFTALILCFLLASCSSGAGGYPMADNSASSATASTENTTGGAEGVGDGSQNVTVENNRKIIEYITFTYRPRILTRWWKASANRFLNAAATWKALKFQETIIIPRETAALPW